ncbi:MAG: glycerol dehydratase reactivase beta/small subunit family protein [Streptococcaceae bacterium]|jgi:hypothetical protein|nr:glycerol dehydratase reactivase beta/small subunit family protein [Streptococcaceae bacterium]
MTIKPSIHVAQLGTRLSISPVLWGIEEEGIPFEVIENKAQQAVVDEAYNLACDSALLVGIAVDDKQAVLHFKKLPQNKPLFVVGTSEKELMTLGANAARLVKGIGFKKIENGEKNEQRTWYD